MENPQASLMTHTRSHSLTQYLKGNACVGQHSGSYVWREEDSSSVILNTSQQQESNFIYERNSDDDVDCNTRLISPEVNTCDTNRIHSSSSYNEERYWVAYLSKLRAQLFLSGDDEHLTSTFDPAISFQDYCMASSAPRGISTSCILGRDPPLGSSERATTTTLHEHHTPHVITKETEKVYEFEDQAEDSSLNLAPAYLDKMSNTGSTTAQDDDTTKEATKDKIDFEPLELSRPLVSSQNNQPPGMPRKFVIIAFSIKILVILTLIIIGFLLYHYRQAVNQWLDNMMCLNRRLGLWSPITFVPVATIFISLLLPAEFIILSAGFLFTHGDEFGEKGGFAVALICSVLAMFLSSIVDFFVCRKWLFSPTHRALGKYALFRAFTKAVKDGGGYFVSLLRLSPLVPFAISNCLLAVTEISFLQVMAGFPCSLPIITLTVYLGSALDALRDVAHPHMEWNCTKITLLVIGIICATLAMGYVGYLTKKRLYAFAAEENNQQDFNNGIELATEP